MNKDNILIYFNYRFELFSSVYGFIVLNYVNEAIDSWRILYYIIFKVMIFCTIIYNINSQRVFDFTY